MKTHAEHSTASFLQQSKQRLLCGFSTALSALSHRKKSCLFFDKLPREVCYKSVLFRISITDILDPGHDLHRTLYNYEFLSGPLWYTSSTHVHDAASLAQASRRCQKVGLRTCKTRSSIQNTFAFVGRLGEISIGESCHALAALCTIEEDGHIHLRHQFHYCRRSSGSAHKA